MVKRQDADSLDSLINDSRFTHLACWSLGAVTPSLATAFRILPATAVPHVRTMAPGEHRLTELGGSRAIVHHQLFNFRHIRLELLDLLLLSVQSRVLIASFH
ncbi:hypothetical protein R6Q59_015659 [Mikania micrantha]